MLLGSVGVSLGASACDRDDRPSREPPSEPAPVASVAKALGVDAGELEPAVDPPAAAGDLKADIDGFTSLDACVAQRANLDALLGDALEAIGYDTFVRDACRVLDAAKAKDPKRCDAIDASSLRRQCATTVAAVVGDAESCPWSIASRPEEGRDPWCLAAASRDARLCMALETMASRATCAATIAHDASSCAKLPMKADQARCRRDVERWKAVLPPPDPSAPAPTPPQGTLHIEGGDAGGPSDTSFASTVERGVVLLEQRDGSRLSLGSVSATGASFLAASPHTLATLGVELFASPDGKRVTVERAELSVPGRPALATPLAHSSLVAKVDKLEHARGGAVSLSLDGELSDSTGSYRLHVQATTFVRDVVTAKALYGSRAGLGAGLPGLGALPGFGDAGAMR
jgi:hypothetical protein